MDFTSGNKCMHCVIYVPKEWDKVPGICDVFCPASVRINLLMVALSKKQSA